MTRNHQPAVRTEPTWFDHFKSALYAIFAVCLIIVGMALAAFGVGYAVTGSLVFGAALFVGGIVGCAAVMASIQQWFDR
jgi:uncharacterized membrane-anchored protein YitT (DUF2179 family)